MNNSYRNSFKRHYMLKKRSDIDLLFAKGNKLITPCIDIYSLTQKKEENFKGIKIFVAVPKKKIQKANKRNLIKRRIKENIRLSIHDIKTTCQEKNITLFLAFVYNKKYIEEFSTIKEIINTKLKQINDKINNEN